MLYGTTSAFARTQRRLRAISENPVRRSSVSKLDVYEHPASCNSARRGNKVVQMTSPTEGVSPESPGKLASLDQRGSSVLSLAECHALLRHTSGRYGRIGINMNGAPVVLPLNFVLLDAGVLLRIGPGSTLDAIADEPAVAFEIDGLDWPAAWSVLVQGTASVMRDPLLIEQAASSGLTPLVGEPGEVYVLISMSAISGRRFQVGPLARSGVSAPDLEP